MPHLREIAAAAVFALCLVAAPAFAAGLQVEKAWAVMESHDGEVGVGVFMTITNSGSRPDRLYAAKSKVAKMVELRVDAHDRSHVLAATEGKGHATALSFEIGPGETLRLGRDGRHLMLHDIRSPLRAGDSFDLTLFFEEGGPVKVAVPVRNKML